MTVDDFTTLKLIGKGSYGKVFLVEKKDDKNIYAMKILKKKAMIKRNQVNHIKTERKIMEKSHKNRTKNNGINRSSLYS